MIEWLSSNWEGLLGTGGFGVIIVAFIARRRKNNSSSNISQKMKSGDNSTSYQSGGNITINTDRKDD